MIRESWYKNRLLDPSEICALDFKREFRRSAISSVSPTIGTNWSILVSSCHCDRIKPNRKNTVSPQQKRENQTFSTEGPESGFV
jgi:hypothetical protein